MGTGITLQARRRPGELRGDGRGGAAARIRSSTPAIKSRLIGYGRTLLRGDLFIPRMVGYLASAPSASFAQSSVPVRAEDSLAVLTVLWIGFQP
jgi:hypothetical protein